MEAIFGWLSEHGVMAVIGAFFLALQPQLWALLRELVNGVKQQRLREILLVLVKAAEQIYGPQPATTADAETVGELKRNFVLEQAQEKGLAVTRNDVEAAVYDAKRKATQAKALATTAAAKL